MQIKVFTIPVGDSGGAQDEMNRFLRTSKVLDIKDQLIATENGAYWCFCVRYIEKTNPSKGKSTKVDYKAILDEAAFEKFSKLRVIRKKLAADEGLPAFAIFTDEELAGLAKLDKLTEKSMRTVKGVGDKKIERFARHFMEGMGTNEAARSSD